MDDLEFRKNAIIDPCSQTPEFLEKTRQSRNNQSFVENQQSFNQELLNTLEFSTPENLSDRIILAQQLSQHHLQQKIKRQKHWRNWLGGSIAAAIIMAFSLNLILPGTQNSSLLAQQVIKHVHEDTHALNVHMNVPKTRIDTMLASYGGKLNGPIGQVTFLGHCIIGGHTGIHMVLNTSLGIVSVLLLPSQIINDSSVLNDSQLSGILYPSQKGSIAIVSEQPKAIEAARRQINQNLNWII
ncbi:MAG: DUF3379 family protein [Gammaproteobacteria bacterium]|nr:DUF3379 family protein [Gammaproteobacteria bacterium]